MSIVRTRFAPSPTGHLHIGGARTALFCWLLARHHGGEFYLRIEDTDTERSKQEYTDSILASMHWLGLDYQGEPIYQSQRTEKYTAAVDSLLESGHAYWCSCTPEEVEAMREEARAKGLKPRYNGCCREKNIGSGHGHCVRLKTPKVGKISFDDMVKGVMTVDVNELDDMVIRRGDGMPTYNLAVVIDDNEMGITHVMRGDDHVANTYRQICIYQALNLPLPRFGHVPMILGSDKQKLSKRHGARATIEYEQDGLLPAALINYLVRLGWSHGDQEIFSTDELIKLFDGTSLNVAPSAFDPQKLQWLNAHYLRELSAEELGKQVLPFVHKLSSPIADEDRIGKIAVLFQERANTLLELATAMQPLLIQAHDLVYNEKDLGKTHKMSTAELLLQFGERLGELSDFSSEAIEKTLHDFVENKGLKFKEVGPPLRVALLGAMGGPHLPEVMAVLQKEECLDRIEKFAKQ